MIHAFGNTPTLYEEKQMKNILQNFSALFGWYSAAAAAQFWQQPTLNLALALPVSL